MMGLSTLGRKLFGTVNSRLIHKYKKRLPAILSHEENLKKLSDDSLKQQTIKFQTMLENGAPLESILEEAYATVREASVRNLGIRHFDVQMLGGIALNDGYIAEMSTGEGKTLVATLPVYLNALVNKGVHVVTVNDYLAARDTQWMSQVYNALGLTVGVIKSGITDEERKDAYNAHVTYGTNNEFGFDFLRDNMKFSAQDMVQREFNYAIVDEVDSILIDESRTPLVISGPSENNAQDYLTLNSYIAKLSPDHYEVDEKNRNVNLTEEGQKVLEEHLVKNGKINKQASLYDIENISFLHHAQQALKAHKVFQKDKDYVIKNNKIIIIDEFTGRMMEGRRFGEGLHQALEAKERLPIQSENQTLASITFQNYFRMYPKLAGMTGTAQTEAEEFATIYNLGVIQIPSNKPICRKDKEDEIYLTLKEKVDVLIKSIKERNDKGQPVLVGTISIENSEKLSKFFTQAGIKHNILNARHHNKEAEIIAQAGQINAVTIATNMAGRGTDIQLGGNAEIRIAKELNSIKDPEEYQRRKQIIYDEVNAQRQKVCELGGLYVVATERHESRRIDNQLRGRSGRQGDPGESKFYVSLEDDLMRIFMSDRLDGMLKKIGLSSGEAIIHPWITKAIERAQKKVEGHNFEIRKNLLKFDDVMNDQRKAIYEQRREFINQENVNDIITDMRHTTIEEIVPQYIPPKTYMEKWDISGLQDHVNRLFGSDIPVSEWAKEEGIAEEEIIERLIKATDGIMALRASEIEPHLIRQIEKSILLQVLDQQWKEHLLQMDHLRQGIGLRAYGQKDPLNEYKHEAFGLFENILTVTRLNTTMYLSYVRLQEQNPSMNNRLHGNRPVSFQETHSQSNALETHRPQKTASEYRPVRIGRRMIDGNDPSTWGNVPRNAPCPCGNMLKFKHCHGKIN